MWETRVATWLVFDVAVSLLPFFVAALTKWFAEKCPVAEACVHVLHRGELLIVVSVLLASISGRLLMTRFQPRLTGPSFLVSNMPTGRWSGIADRIRRLGDLGLNAAIFLLCLFSAALWAALQSFDVQNMHLVDASIAAFAGTLGLGVLAVARYE